MKSTRFLRWIARLMAIALFGVTSAHSQDAPNYQTTVSNFTFVTADQLYSDNQMFLSGGPFVYPRPDLHPFVTGVAGESYDYSRSSLGTVNARSGLGVHTLWGPAVGARATDSNDPMARREVLLGMIEKFSKAAGITPPANAWPQFLEFESGDPRLPQAVDADPSDGTTFGNDFASIRWDRSAMNKTLVPAALGQTLFKQVAWAEPFFAMNHRDKQGNTKIGGDPLEGFSGFVLTASEMIALVDAGAYGSHSPTVPTNTANKNFPRYRCPNVHYRFDAVYTNLTIGGAMRGYGTTQGAFALECTMDELADELGMDPLALRLKTTIRKGDVDELSAHIYEFESQPTGEGWPIQSCGLERCLKQGADAVHMGLGYALTEELLHDERGRPLNKGLGDYRIFKTVNMPKLTTLFVETYEPTGPYGAKSIAEIAVNGPAPAIANAVKFAAGVRLYELPLTAERVVKALGKL